MAKRKTKIETSPFEEAQAIIPEILPIDRNADFTGKTLVLNPRMLLQQYRTRQGMIWKITGGFGCVPHLRGKSTGAICLHDKEIMSWQRYDWVGEMPETPQIPE